ncbi:pyridoxal phosphate-dependent aminotransferase [Geoglobus ahangari]
MLVHGDYYERYLKQGLRPLDFASNINPFRPRGLEEFLSERVEVIYHYPHNGYESLVETISDSMGWDCKTIVFGNGSIELIEFFFRIAGRDVAIAQPTFTEYERFARLHGVRVHDIPWDLEAILEFVEGSRPDALVICNPNNPTGEFMRKREIEEVAEVCEKRGVKLMIDQTFIDFVKPHDVEAFQVRSLTKILGIPGLRFGYGMFPKEYARLFHETRLPWNVNTLAKAVAERYLPLLRPFSRHVRRRIGKEREHMKKFLRRLGFECEGKANFLLCRGNLDSGRIFEFLEGRGVLIRRCNDFKGLTLKHFRVAVKKREENRVLLRGLEVLVQEYS